MSEEDILVENFSLNATESSVLVIPSSSSQFTDLGEFSRESRDPIPVTASDETRSGCCCRNSKSKTGPTPGRFDCVFVKRLFRLLFCPSHGGLLIHCRVAWISWIMFVLTIALAVLTAVVGIYRAKLLGNLFKDFAILNYDGLWNGILYVGLIGFGQCLIQMIRSVVISNILGLFWRYHMTRVLLERYFRGKNYYVVLQLKEKSIDNPDQRIDADAASFVSNLAAVGLSGVVYLIQFVYYSVILCREKVYWMLIPIALWVILNVLASIILFTPVSATIFQKDRAEGDFRFLHARVREHAESMAFFNRRSRENIHTKSSEESSATASFFDLRRILFSLSWKYSLMKLYLMVSLTLPGWSDLVVLAILVFCGVSPFVKTLDSQGLTGMITTYASISSQALTALAMFFQLSSSVGLLIGAATRIGQLLETFDEIEQAAEDVEFHAEVDDVGDEEEEESGVRLIPENDDRSVILDPECIEMRGVTVRTPGLQKTLLLRDVSFSLAKGESLVIMGPSGSGKSSILRVLAGLWPLTADEGRIRRPKTSPNDLFFLPQDPYLVKGSLRDNVVYPKSREDVFCSDAQLKTAMVFANAGYLLERASLHEPGVNLTEKLSLGECQRVALARVFFHRPTFVILDEATSALDCDTQERCLDNLRSLGIGMVSVAHRRTVMKHHDYVLRVVPQVVSEDEGEEEGEEGAENRCSSRCVLEKLSHTEADVQFDFSWQTVRKYDVRDDEIVETEANAGLEHLEIDDSDLGRTGINPTMFKRLSRLIFRRILFVSWKEWVLLGVAAVVTIVSSGLSTVFVSMSSEVLGALTTRNLSSTILYVALFFFLLLLKAGLGQVADWLFMVLGIFNRTNLVKYLHTRYFRNNLFYEMNVMDKSIDNIDQRVTQDADSLTSGFDYSAGMAYITELLIMSITLLFSIGIVSLAQTGWPSFVVTITIFSCISIVQLTIMCCVSRARFLLQKKEGYFRNALTRMKEYGEQIAFLDGKAREYSIIERKFGRLMCALVKYRFLSSLQVWLISFVQQNSTLVGFLLVAITASINKSAMEAKTIPERIALIQSEATYTSTSLNSFIGVIGSAAIISTILGNLGRIGQLIEKMDESEERIRERSANERRLSDSRVVAVSDLTCMTPTKRHLFYHLEFRVEQGESLLVVGPSGCGKSSLLRMVAGLWPIFLPGQIECPMLIGEGGLFFLPQRPILVHGSLRSQIIYPDVESRCSDVVLAEILSSVNLGVLLRDRFESLDVCMKEWSTVLSPGEQQRIGLARLLYHRPLFAILDESTSALDPENEDMMYETCARSGINTISVGHRRSLVKFHQKRLSFDGKGSWVLATKVKIESEIMDL